MATGIIPQAAPPPGRVVVAGDWHGDVRWARGVVEQLPRLLPDEAPRRILQLGDFGFRPGSYAVVRLSAELIAAGAELWFVDGNHEDWPALHGDTRPCPGGFRQMAERVYWAPRGTRWRWHGRTWLAVGGAVSVDRALRTPNVDWWPDEEVTAAQARQVAADGPADVVLAHDCPAKVDLKLDPVPDWYGWAKGDLRRSDEHRELLWAVAWETRPRWWIHGHYHRYHQTAADLGYGPVEVTGLDCNNTFSGNYAVLNTETMTWEGTGP